MKDFKDNYIQIADTELWRHLAGLCDKLDGGAQFLAAVEEVCAMGLDISRDIIRLFPTFTLHDGTHSRAVCEWMWVLLGDRAKELTAEEAALLLMSACCHDMGMSVSENQKKRLLQPSFHGWKKHFEENPGDAAEFEAEKEITDPILRNYVRLNHHLRVREHLMTCAWPKTLTFHKIKPEVLELLCESHGTSLSLDKLKSCKEYDLLLCAILLRLADLLDYNADRAPEILFRHMGLDHPETPEAERSAREQKKNQVGVFVKTITDNVLNYCAEFEDLQQEKDVRQYLDWVTEELNHCAEQLTQTASRWKDLPLPYKISTDGAHRNGYAYGEFCMTMDQDKVIKLLTGKDIYPDPGVFVRELLQNAIDAVLMREKQDPNFRLEDGQISIDTWPAGDGDTWFRIRDNGTGMNERIITNYFLKVGRSYYTSKEFLAANRTAPGGAYTAISRFGIGILSCFMEDRDGGNTELKVATKRFGCDEENGIRLDVTGLHGYYYLAHEQQHPDYAASFLKMPSPDDDDCGYRTEPGTTICVKTNLFRMGGARSFVEILDKYVQFPEVRVTYNGPDGHRDYPTQQELMAAVEALNPGDTIQEYVHPFPADQAQELRERFHIFRWTKDPELVLRYYPVNRLSDSENMTGVAVSVELRYPPELRWGAVDPADEDRIRLDWDVSVEQQMSLRVRLVDASQRIKTRYPGMTLGIRNSVFPVAGSGSILSPQEQKVWDLLMASLGAVKGKNGHIAYHGVLAAEKELLGGYREKLFSVVLLRGSFLPDVNVARNQIRGLSTEAACCHAMAVRKLGEFGHAGDLLDLESAQLLTQRQLWAVLEQYPRWQEMLKKQQASEGNPNQVEYHGKLMEGMGLCNVKQEHAVELGFDAHYPHFEISAAPSDEDTVDFPVGMFALPQKENCDILANLFWRRNVYNRDHVFSRWLIGHRAALEKKVPAVYDTLIRALLSGVDKKLICDTVNTILTRLRSFENNCFHIHDDLFLKKSDFKE